jgi:hypothetical protein
MAGTREAAHDIAAHAPQADHSELHLNLFSIRAQKFTPALTPEFAGQHP